jgi:hypothetical protein
VGHALVMNLAVFYLFDRATPEYFLANTGWRLVAGMLVRPNWQWPHWLGVLVAFLLGSGSILWIALPLLRSQPAFGGFNGSNPAAHLPGLLALCPDPRLHDLPADRAPQAGVSEPAGPNWRPAAPPVCVRACRRPRGGA